MFIGKFGVSVMFGINLRWMIAKLTLFSASASPRQSFWVSQKPDALPEPISRWMSDAFLQVDSFSRRCSVLTYFYIFFFLYFYFSNYNFSGV